MGSCGVYPTITPITETKAPVTGHICDTANPCQNGCSCQASCRDENDYVCVPAPGFPFVGKNCEWAVNVQCTSNNEVQIDVPSAAVDAFQMNVPNGMIQGCNRPDYMCDATSRSCGPAKNSFNGFYSLTCPGSFSQSQTG